MSELTTEQIITTHTIKANDNTYEITIYDGGHLNYGCKIKKNSDLVMQNPDFIEAHIISGENGDKHDKDNLNKFIELEKEYFIEIADLCYSFKVNKLKTVT